jgi:hypothetical protein
MKLKVHTEFYKEHIRYIIKLFISTITALNSTKQPAWIGRACSATSRHTITVLRYITCVHERIAMFPQQRQTVNWWQRAPRACSSIRTLSLRLRWLSGSTEKVHNLLAAVLSPAGNLIHLSKQASLTSPSRGTHAHWINYDVIKFWTRVGTGGRVE